MLLKFFLNCMFRQWHFRSAFKLPLSITIPSYLYTVPIYKEVSYAPHNTFVIRRGIIHLISL